MTRPSRGTATAHRRQGAPLSRQPIFRSDLEVYGYELFVEPSAGNRPELLDLIECVQRELRLGVGGGRIFVNLTREAILSSDCDRLPVERVVLEVLESVAPEPDVVRELQRLSDRGYRIALDDFLYGPAKTPFLDLADIVKLDLLVTPADELRALARALVPFNVCLLAEKIETEAHLDLARELGCDYLQGFFLARPTSGS